MFKNKKIVVGTIVVILFLTAIWFFKNAGVGRNIISEEISLVRIAVAGEKTSFGFAKIPFLKDGKNFRFLNVAIDFNNDGEFGQYPAEENKIQSEWLIKNMPVRFEEKMNSFSFSLPDRAEEKIPTEGLKLIGVLTQTIIDSPDWPVILPEKKSVREIIIDAITVEDIGNLQSPAPGRDGGFDFIYDDDFVPPVYAEGAKPAIDVFHADVPDILQKTNECAPTSAANSLIWLAKKFNFEDKLPGQAELIEELKNDMAWENGIQPGNFLTGKEKITTRRKLPLTNKKVGAMDGTGTFEAMYEELKKDQDVEMRIQYKNARGNPVSGHWVTVVGVERLSNGAEIINVHDPLSPGPALLQNYRLDKTDFGFKIADYPYGQAYVSFAVAESYQPPATPSTTPALISPTLPPISSTPSVSPAVTLKVSPANASFEHEIGRSPCPQMIVSLNLTGNGAWKIKNHLPMWLQTINTGSLPQTINLSFTCQLQSYVTQTVSETLIFQMTDSNGNPVGEPKNVSVTGRIIAK